MSWGWKEARSSFDSPSLREGVPALALFIVKNRLARLDRRLPGLTFIITSPVVFRVAAAVGHPAP